MFKRTSINVRDQILVLDLFFLFRLEFLHLFIDGWCIRRFLSLHTKGKGVSPLFRPTNPDTWQPAASS